MRESKIIELFLVLIRKILWVKITDLDGKFCFPWESQIQASVKAWGVISLQFLKWWCVSFFSSALHSIWEIQTSCYYVWLLLLEVGRIYQHVWDVETWRTSNWGVGESHFRLYFQKIGNTGTGWWAEDWIAKDFCRNSTQLKSWRVKEITTVCRLLETSYYHIWSAFLSLCWC